LNLNRKSKNVVNSRV